MKPPARFEIAPCPMADVLRLERELGVSHVLAQVLVRRGLTDPTAARTWMVADERHDAGAFAGIEDAVALALDHVARGSRVTIHGDYDVDGVCATAVLVRALRTLGADVDWYLPGRMEDGYGLSATTVARLAERGTRLLITADCAITAVDEVAAARAAGLDVVVTDHHAPRADGVLPDAPIVHPAVCAYPCADLCAAAVAHKFVDALRRAGAGADPDEDLDLVALATVADVVALRGENRRLVRTGLRALAATAKPGLRALMAIARVDPSAVDAHAVAFRLAPRINAAGRLYRADAGLELLLTDDAQRAAQIADELDRANAERRHTETRILFEAEAQVAEVGEQPAYVLAGEGWHPGVIGIVATRIAERHHRPAVLIALPAAEVPIGGADARAVTAERGVGSARSIAAFDLLAGLTAASAHLERYGGHRAAAGLELRSDRICAFRAAFVAHAAGALTPDELMPRERVDAIVSGDELGVTLAEELEQLAPFGAGNPGVSLLVPAAGLSDARPMGEGEHVRFTVSAGGARARAVAFGAGGRLPVADTTPADASFRLELNEWRGAVEPRLVLRHAQACAPAPIACVGEPDRYLDGVWLEVGGPLRPALPAHGAPARAARTERDRRGRGIAGTLAALVASGEPVLALCADTPRRASQLRDRLGGFALASHEALERDPELAASAQHIVVIDPPAHAQQAALARAGAPDQMTHLAWGEPELRFARRAHELEYDLRPSLTELYRALRAAGRVGGPELEALLRGAGPQRRSPWLAGRLLRVMQELDLVELDSDRAIVAVTSAAHTALERSIAYRTYAQRHEDGRRFLGSATAQAA